MATPSILQGINIDRALKDAEYRESLSDEQRQALLEVAGVSKLSDDDLDTVAGGLASDTNRCLTVKCLPPVGEPSYH